MDSNVPSMSIAEVICIYIVCIHSKYPDSLPTANNKRRGLIRYRIKHCINKTSINYANSYI